MTPGESNADTGESGKRGSFLTAKGRLEKYITFLMAFFVTVSLQYNFFFCY